jgi:hypothetical protein
VLREVVAQLNNQGDRRFADDLALRGHLEDILVVSGTAPSLQLSYQSNDEQGVVSLLETLGRAFLGYQTQQDRIEGRPNSATVAQQAQRIKTPVVDQRLTYTAYIAGAMAAAALLLMLIFQSWLKRSRSMFDPEEAPLLTVLDKPATWSPLAEGGKDKG